MKDFLKMVGAVIIGFLILNVVGFFIMLAFIGGIAALGSAQPVMPRSAVLKIDFNELLLGEQTTDIDPMTAIQGNTSSVIGILDAIRAINAAAEDPAVQFIYMKPDMATGGMAEIEEFRDALMDFRLSGKAVISYIENPSNAGYYLASASDKIYMTTYGGGMNTFTGISSQMIFLKDLLDKLGVNVQLIRHGKYKSAGEMFIRNSPSSENEAQYQALISSIWGSWSSEIAQARNISVEDLNAALDELKLNLPQDFVDCGLVDELLNTEGIKNKIASYANVGSYSEVEEIRLSDYATLKVQPNYKADKKVAVIYASGDIVEGDETTGVASERFAKIISDLREDDDIKAVVLRVNSPGGSVLAADKIKEEITRLAAEKPVVASYGDYAASGGYWISAGCEKIFTNSSTLTGSIGVFSMIPDLSGTLDKIAHVNIATVNSNKHSDIYSLTRPLTDKEVAYMQASVEQIYDKFTDIVAEGRDLDKDYVDSIAQGRVWAGNDALKINLADNDGNIMDALCYAITMAEDSDLTQWDIVEYPKPMTTLETLMEALGGNTATVFKNTVFSDVELAFKNLNLSSDGAVYARMPYEIIIR